MPSHARTAGRLSGDAAGGETRVASPAGPGRLPPGDSAMPSTMMLVLLAPLYVVLALLGGAGAVFAVLGAAALFAIVVGIAQRLWLDRRRRHAAIGEPTQARTTGER